MPEKHALLSPSSSARWLSCTKSARLEAQFPDTSGEEAKEGTLAHELAEITLKHEIKAINEETFQERKEAIYSNPRFSPAMERHVADYVAYCLSCLRETGQSAEDCAAPFMEVECPFDLSLYFPRSFGTCDCLIIAEPVLHVIDLKYGQGVRVEAENNTQLKCYALGALLLYEDILDIQAIQATIYQPRLDNIKTVGYTRAELLNWAQSVKHLAELAFQGGGEYKPTEDNCRFCKAKGACRARADENLKLAQYDFQKPDLLDEEELGEILKALQQFNPWAKDVEQYALSQMRDFGRSIPGWKIVEGRSNRQYRDEQKVLDALLAAEFHLEDVAQTKVLGITALEKQIGKKTFQEVLGDLVIKPEGKPTLAEETDPRPALRSLEEAQKDFNNIA